MHLVERMTAAQLFFARHKKEYDHDSSTTVSIKAACTCLLHGTLNRKCAQLQKNRVYCSHPSPFPIVYFILVRFHQKRLGSLTNCTRSDRAQPRAMKNP